MEVTIKSLSESQIEENDYQDRVDIEVNGKRVVSFSDGEPEDNTLGRNFRGVYNIPDLMKQANEAGRAGEEFTIKELNIDEL